MGQVTYKHIILEALQAENKEGLQKVIAIAYWMGEERATKRVSDDYINLIKAQQERAMQCRYYKLASKIIGDVDYIYYPEYRQDITNGIANDKSNIR